MRFQGYSKTMRSLLLSACTMSFIAGTVATTQACTRYLCNRPGEPVVTGRTMDLFMSDKAEVVVFPRGEKRESTGAPDGIVWTSKYGSVAVTALDFATSDGMNEKGLATNLLYLNKTVYPQPNGKPTLSNALWAQYVLDNYATVPEALAGLEKVRIFGLHVAGHDWPMHLSIEDASGDSAVIEFVDGKEVIHHGRQYTIMTNEPPLDVQLANLKRYSKFGGTLPLPGDIDPKDRFVRAATFAKMMPVAKDEPEAVANAIAVLRTTAVPPGALDTSGEDPDVDTWPTRWFSVADQTNRIYYFESMTSPNVFWVDLSKIDFAPSDKVAKIDAYDTKWSGDVSSQFPTVKTPG